MTTKTQWVCNVADSHRNRSILQRLSFRCPMKVSQEGQLSHIVPPQLGACNSPMKDPAATILDVSMSYAVSRFLHVLAEIGVADALGDSPRTATDLAASTGPNAGPPAALGLRCLRRVQRWFRPHTGLAVAAHGSPPVHAIVRALDRSSHRLAKLRVAKALRAYGKPGRGAGHARRRLGILGAASRNKSHL